LYVALRYDNLTIQFIVLFANVKASEIICPPKPRER
jgi:hypothetical protein